MQASKRMRRGLAAIILVAGGSIGLGCQKNELETGYKFNRLGGSTQTQRRAYYAGPFSPEARQAMMESNNGDVPSAMRRPTPGQ